MGGPSTSTVSRNQYDLLSSSISLMALLICTEVAISEVPERPLTAGAMSFSAMVLSAGLVAPLLFSLLYAPKEVLRVEHLLMVGLVYWLLIELIQGVVSLPNLSRACVRDGLRAIGMFAMGINVAGIHPAWPLPGFVVRAANVRLQAGTLTAVIITCFVLGMATFAFPCNFDIYLMVSSLARTRFAAPWSRGSLGDWRAFVDHLMFFGMLLPPLTVLLAARLKSWLHAKTVMAIIMSVVVTLFIMQNGGRRLVGTMYGSALLIWTLLQGSIFRSKTVLIFSLSLALTLLTMQLMLEYRNVGLATLGQKDQVISTLSVIVDNNFYSLCQVLDIIPRAHPFVGEQLLVYVAVRPVPRVWWPGKPVNPGFDLAAALGVKGGTVFTVSIVGDLYMSFGWAGIFLGGWVFGRLARMVNEIRYVSDSPIRLLIYVIGTMALFAALRNLIELVLVSYILLAWFAVSAILTFPRRAPLPYT